MPTNLIENILSEFKPGIISQLSRMTGEGDSTLLRALGTIVPVILAALSKLGMSTDGATQILRMIQGVDSNALANAATNASQPGSLNTVMSTGEDIVRGIFGDKSSSVLQAVSTSTGLGSSSISKLMSLAAPLVLGNVGREIRTQGSSVGALQNLLSSQKDLIQGYLPSGIAPALAGLVTGTGSHSATAPRRPVETPPKARSALGPAGWLGLAALVLLGLFLFNRNQAQQQMARNIDAATEAAQRQANRINQESRAMLNSATDTTAQIGRNVMQRIAVNLPGGVSMNIPEGSLEDKFAKYLAAPRTPGNSPVFQFDRLAFETGSAKLAGTSEEQLQNIATILKAYPAVSVAIRGHTDNAGDPAANLVLSQNRADSVRSELVRMGVPSNRLTATGLGDQQPIALNTTETGKAINRRIDIQVVM